MLSVEVPDCSQAPGLTLAEQLGQQQSCWRHTEHSKGKQMPDELSTDRYKQACTTYSLTGPFQGAPSVSTQYRGKAEE